MRTMPRVVLGFVVLLLAAVPSRAQSVCGNGVLEPGEQCDDGNTRNGDGCSAGCKFEQNQRITQLKMQFNATSARCTANAIGNAIVGSIAQSQIQMSTDSGIFTGAMSLLLVMYGLSDLTGATTQSFRVGVIDGAWAPMQPGGSYNGTSDLDWWYIPTVSELDAARLPLGTMSAATAGSQFTAGPGSATIPVGFGRISLSALNLKAAVGPSNAPAIAPSYFPPGHLASEHLDPTLTSFASLAPSADGEMCGNVSAASLAAIPLPSTFYSTNCNNFFSSGNTYLDLLVAGCKVLGILPEVASTQPDQIDAAAPVAGGGPPYVLVLDASNHVASCTAKGAAATLPDCLNAAAYSIFYKFSADRVIERACPDAPVATNDGPICPGGTVHLTAAGQVGDYAWTGPAGFTSTIQNPTVTNATAGDYSVTVTFAGCTSPAATTTVVPKSAPAPSVTAPANAAAGQQHLAASTPAHSGDTYAWVVTKGTITAGQGTNQITFTAGTSGSTGVSVTETTTSTGCSASASASVSIVFGPPQNVVATATGNDVLVTWTPTVGAVSYEVSRRNIAGVAVIGLVTTNSLPDNGLAPNAAYLYTVRAIDAAVNFSAPSIGDLATTVPFTDDPLAGGTTVIQAAHIAQLRTAINAVSELFPLSDAAFTDPNLADIPVRAVHISELRAALDHARSVLSLPPLTYTDPTLTAGTTFVKAMHVQELREGVK